MTTTTAPTIADLQRLAAEAGWTKLHTTKGRTYYRTLNGGREWTAETESSLGFLFLYLEHRPTGA